MYNTLDALRQLLEQDTGSELSDSDNSGDENYLPNNQELSEDEDHVSEVDE